LDTLTTLRSFLTNIRPVCTTDYQIRGAAGELLFDTGNGQTPSIDSGTARKLCDRLLASNEFAYDAVDPHLFLCGRSLIVTAQPPLLLLAYGPIHNGIAPEEHCRKLQTHLDGTAALVTEKLNHHAEIEELAQQLEHSFEDLYLYDRISSQIKSLKLSEQMLNNLIVEVVENMQVDMAFVTLPQHPEFNLQIVRPESGIRLEDQETFLTRLEALAKPHIDGAEENYFILNDSRENNVGCRLAPIPYRFLMVGVRHQRQLYGWLGLVAFDLDEIFRQGELRMLKAMAEQLAIVISNTNLYNDLELFTVNMVSSLVSAIEAKDAYTRGHSERVYRYSMEMARAHGLKGEAMEALKWAAILHDVGKIGVPEDILLKPGKLTDDEYALIKEHPEKGYKILKPVAQLSPSMGGILHHHERYDGKGYPHGLRGEAIPLAARMIAVADTFDAITSRRTYRDAKSSQEALAIIESVAGTQLDPNMVALFKTICLTTEAEIAERSRR
jgi:HD-GYP domain-containing protein (c-di-GMP phosphodiesterase class II)